MRISRRLPVLVLGVLFASLLFGASAFASGPPVVVSESVTGVTETRATIHATVNPEGFETYVYVEYGKYREESFTEPVRIEAGETEVEETIRLKNLKPGTTYPFHVIVVNSQGGGGGVEMTFKTLPPPTPPGAGWTLDSVAAPTNFSESESAECLAGVEVAAQHEPLCDSYEVTAMNAGDEPTSGPVTLTDTLPQGVTVKGITWQLLENGDTLNGDGKIGGLLVGKEVIEEKGGSIACPSTGPVVQCTVSGFALPVGDWLKMIVYVSVDEDGVGGS